MQFLDMIWNLKPLKGYRTLIAQAFIYVGSAVMGYQAAATSENLINQGIDFPDLPPPVLAGAALIVGYFGKKIKQFALEHGKPASS